jgi:hypothetical protein
MRLEGQLIIITYKLKNNVHKYSETLKMCLL